MTYNAPSPVLGVGERAVNRIEGRAFMELTLRGPGGTRNCTFPWCPPSGSLVHALACLREGTFSITHSFVPAALGSAPRSENTDEGGPVPRALTPGTIHLCTMSPGLRVRSGLRPWFFSLTNDVEPLMRDLPGLSFFIC